MGANHQGTDPQGDGGHGNNPASVDGHSGSKPGTKREPRTGPDSLKGSQFGKLLVLEDYKGTGDQKAVCFCRCSCGTEKLVGRSDLKGGRINSCGCSRAPSDIVGKRFNLLVVLETFKEKKGTRTQIFCRCQCDCGNETIVHKGAITSGSTKSCGCSKVVTIPNGTTFGRLTVTKKVKVPKGFAYECSCSCGGSHTVQGAFLKLGLTKSCGCLLRHPEHTPAGQAGFKMVCYVYRANAKRHGREFLLSDEQLAGLFQQNCHYCGAPPSSVKCKTEHGRYLYNGLDRVNNQKGYTEDNVVTACWDCNRAKAGHAAGDFLDWVGRVHHPEKKVVSKIVPNTAKYGQYRNSARTRKLPFNLELDEFSALVQSPCAYCGKPPTSKMGVDRMDNAIGYTTANCVPCCYRCNKAKSTGAVEDFIVWAKRVQEYQRLSSTR